MAGRLQPPLTDGLESTKLTGMEPVPVLHAIEGSLSGRQWEITTQGLYIGREPRNEIIIEEAGISRQHARVLLYNDAIWVQDIGSRNGVFVNSNRVPDNKQIKPGDRVTVGSITFEVSMRNHAVSAPPIASRDDDREVPMGLLDRPSLPWPLVALAAFLLGISLTALVMYLRQS